MFDQRFTKISDAAFEAAYHAAETRSEKDYRGYPGGGLIQFVHTGGAVTHMRYIGGDWPGALQCNRRLARA